MTNRRRLTTALFIGITMTGITLLVSGILIGIVPVIVTGVILIGLGAFSTFMMCLDSRT